MLTQLWRNAFPFIHYLEAERQRFSSLCTWNSLCLSWTPDPILLIMDMGAFGR